MPERHINGGTTMRSRRLSIAALLVAALVTTGCGSVAGADEATQEPAKVEPIDGTDQSRIILSADAARRIGLTTTEVKAASGSSSFMTAVPYSAIVYWLDGGAWVYEQSAPLTFVRRPVVVDNVHGDRATLSSGPPVGADVVEVGSVELLGTEFEIEGE
jgi:predicted small secreted protein